MSGGGDLTAAYVLHYVVHGDTSFIVDVFTLNSGLVSMYARGGRSGKQRALYQPFRPLFVSWTGERDLKTLTGIEASGSARDYNDTSLACAYYFNELLLRLLPKFVAQEELFGHYLVALSALENAAAPASADPAQTTTARLQALEPHLRRFELQLLNALGVAPDFAYCADDQMPPEADARYRFYPSLGRAATVLEEVPDHDPWHIHRQAKSRNDAGVEVAGSSLLALADEDMECRESSADIKRIMRPLLRIQLGDRPLKSRRYFESLVRG